jgi:hypothetical protein
MSTVSAKVAQRIGAGIKKFQPILAAAKARDVNESDTVVIVTDRRLVAICCLARDAGSIERFRVIRLSRRRIIGRRVFIV